MAQLGTLKQKAGQSGSADAHPFLRNERLEIRVSSQEKQRITQHQTELGFGTVAQYVRSQALTQGKARSTTEQHKALMACAYQFNKMGNNLNQIARHLNQGQPFSEEVKLVLLQILDCANELVKDAKGRSGEQT
jgi:hypothetical protein